MSIVSTLSRSATVRTTPWASFYLPLPCTSPLEHAAAAFAEAQLIALHDDVTIEYGAPAVSTAVAFLFNAATSIGLPVVFGTIRPCLGRHGHNRLLHFMKLQAHTMAGCVTVNDLE
jgi:hypothetical protein